MADKVAFELVSPERLLLSAEVDMVVVPGVDGDFGVLPNHSPTISAVRPGMIAVFQSGQVDKRIFVAGGFAEVTPERCTVLADEALPVDEIDRAAAETEARNSRDDIGAARDDRERNGAARRLAVAEAKLAISAKPPY